MDRYLHDQGRAGNPGHRPEKNIGRFNSYAEVTFRWISKLTASLNTGRFTHALTANYHSGYTDQVYNEDDSVVREVLADGSLGDYVAISRVVAPTPPSTGRPRRNWQAVHPDRRYQEPADIAAIHHPQRRWRQPVGL
jgi:hypothetical protein